MPMIDRRRRAGFTLIEMVIVVMVLTILIAIAIPQVMRARQNARTKGCIANLWQIQSAEQRWAFENSKTAEDVPNHDDLVPVYMKDWPECPEGGDYTLESVDKTPVCSIGDPHIIR